MSKFLQPIVLTENIHTDNLTKLRWFWWRPFSSYVRLHNNPKTHNMLANKKFRLRVLYWKIIA